MSDLHLVTDQDQYDFLIEIYRGMTSGSTSSVSESLIPIKNEIEKETDFISSKILLSFGNITIDLVEKRSHGSIEQCQIQLLQPYIQYHSYSNKRSQVEISVDQAIMRNKKESRMYFRDMISAKEGISKKQILISYSSPPFGSSSFVCTWESIVCLFSLDFISFVIGFFSKPWFTPLLPYFTSDTPPSSYTNSYQLILKNPEIVFLDDPSLPTTEALVLSCPEIILGMNAIIMISAQPTMLYLTSMDLRKELAVKLVEDLKWSFTIDTNVENQTHIFVDISPILMRMSFSDISIFYRILLKNFLSSDSTCTPTPIKEESSSSSTTIQTKQIVSFF